MVSASFSFLSKEKRVLLEEVSTYIEAYLFRQSGESLLLELEAFHLRHVEI